MEHAESGRLTQLMSVLRQNIPEWRTCSIDAEPLPGGMTNRNYRVRVANVSYFVRCGTEQSEILGINRELEYQANQLMANIGIAPTVRHYLKAERILITDFIEGNVLTLETLAQSQMVYQVGQMLRKIHRAGRLSGSFSPFETVRHYRDVLGDHGSLDHEAALLVAQCARVEESIPNRLDSVCHNDLLAANFIQDGSGRIWIIDWEYASMGIAMFDLANFAANQNLTEDMETVLLQGYWGHVSDSKRAHLRLMRVMSNAREALWGRVQQAISPIDFDFGAYAQDFIQRAFQAIHCDRFEEDLERARQDYFLSGAGDEAL